MTECSECGAKVLAPSSFCTACGAHRRPVYSDTSSYAAHAFPRQPLPTGGPQHVAARGVAQTLGLHPTIAVATVAVDLMLHTADIISGGLLIPFSAIAGVALGIIAFRGQRQWFADDKDSALTKALIVAALTILPSPLPYALFVPAGLIGLFRRK